ncbi:MAG: sulfatase-like hydrolase/transferase [Verrucomicrobiota bacterium]
MKLFLRLIFLLVALNLVSLVRADAPNIILILADDMGYGDLGFTGSRHLRTPHLDALAESGVFCEQGYVTSPVCSPSRAGLLTGRDPRRFGYQGNLNKEDSAYPTRPELLGLPPGEHTLGDHLRAAGYATALIGKWHQGIGEGFHPNERGFDYFCGMLSGGHSYFPGKGKNRIERNGVPVTEFSSDYLTDFFTDEGLAWMKTQAKSERPWFVFLSYNAPHGPMQATEEDIALFPHIEDEKRRIYAAMMWALDRGVGRVREWLEESGELEDTLIVFFSDNGGPTPNNASWNGPLSGGKGCLKEGGIRVPMIWSWPGTLPAAGRYSAPASALDLLPSFLAAAGSEPLPVRERFGHEDKRNYNLYAEKFGDYEGIDLLPLLKGQENPPHRTLFWRLQGQAVVRDGDDKLCRLSHRPSQQFNPVLDPGEVSDLSSPGNERFLELFRLLSEWESSLPTDPLWGSSPYWEGPSAKYYDELLPVPEPD